MRRNGVTDDARHVAVDWLHLTQRRAHGLAARAGRHNLNIVEVREARGCGQRSILGLAVCI